MNKLNIPAGIYYVKPTRLQVTPITRVAVNANTDKVEDISANIAGDFDRISVAKDGTYKVTKAEDLDIHLIKTRKGQNKMVNIQGKPYPAKIDDNTTFAVPQSQKVRFDEFKTGYHDYPVLVQEYKGKLFVQILPDFMYQYWQREHGKYATTAEKIKDILFMTYQPLTVSSTEPHYEELRQTIRKATANYLPDLKDKDYDVEVEGIDIQKTTEHPERAYIIILADDGYDGKDWSVLNREVSVK